MRLAGQSSAWSENVKNGVHNLRKGNNTHYTSQGQITDAPVKQRTLDH